MTLITTPNIKDPDEVYATLIAAHKGLSEAESHAMNARLVLLLMNHIGDLGVIEAALHAARQSERQKAG